MDADHDRLLLTAQSAPDWVMRSASLLPAEAAEATQWILKDSLHVREILLAAALDLELRLLRFES